MKHEKKREMRRGMEESVCVKSGFFECLCILIGSVLCPKCAHVKGVPLSIRRCLR